MCTKDAMFFEKCGHVSLPKWFQNWHGCLEDMYIEANLVLATAGHDMMVKISTISLSDPRLALLSATKIAKR